MQPIHKIHVLNLTCTEFVEVYTLFLSIYLTVIYGGTVSQVKELKLHDQWAESCVPSGGAVVNPDPTGRRNGRVAPQEGDLIFIKTKLRIEAFGRRSVEAKALALQHTCSHSCPL